MNAGAVNPRRLIVGFDDNLGLPAGLVDHLGCDTRSFHELGELVTSLEDGSVDAAMVPAGTLPALDSTPIVLAQATLAGSAAHPRRSTTLTSVLVTSTPAVRTATAALGTRIARVNRYCTTSFWAPLIAMCEHTPAGTPVQFWDATGFADMAASTIDGRSDAAMIWDRVLDQHPEVRTGTRELLRDDQLPTPVVLASPRLDAARRVALGVAVRSMPWSADADPDTSGGCAFDGFVDADLAAIGRFARRMHTAQEHFQLSAARLAA